MQRQSLYSKTGFAAGIVSAALISSSALGAGFEKNVQWSGKWVGVGGAAVSAVKGAESLYFNPAGLAMDHQGFEASGNFSPTWGKFQGPQLAPNNQYSTGYTFSPVFGALVDYGITPQWGIGVGAFVGGGTKADYDGVVPPNTTLPGGPVHADLYVVDYSIGTGYEVLPGLRLGAAWRISQVKAGFKQITPLGASAAAYTSIDNITATKYNGFRVGAQYTAPENKWGLGANYRSNVDFTGTGNLTTTVAGLPLPTSTSNNTTVASALPTQIEVGGNVAVTDSIRLFADYVWTNYSHNQVLTIVAPGAAGQEINLGWKNMSNVRVAAECTALQDWAFRAGYVYTSQVTPDGFARPTFTAPGHGNTITVGAGHTLMDKALSVDGAVERSWTSGTTTAATQTPVYGDYSASDWALHLGATYRF